MFISSRPSTTAHLTAAVAMTFTASAIATSAHAAPVITASPTLGPGEFSEGGVRFREFSAGIGTGGNAGNDIEILVGDPNVNALPRGQANLNYTLGANPFEITYTASSGLLSASVNGTGTSWNVGNDPFQSLLIDVIERPRTVGNDNAPTPSVSLSNVTFNGSPLGTGTFDPSPTSVGSLTWKVTGLDLQSDFTILGDLNLGGTLSVSAEQNRVEFNLLVPEPGTFGLASLGALAMLRRRRANR
ncbi:MAG: PEP-CTERM sorting domain-containing protein [Planctomycetota bacterium]